MEAMESSARVLLEEARRDETHRKYLRDNVHRLMTSIRTKYKYQEDHVTSKERSVHEKIAENERGRGRGKKEKHAGDAHRDKDRQQEEGDAGEMERDVCELILSLCEPEKMKHEKCIKSFIRHQHQRIEESVRQEQEKKMQQRRRRRRRRRQDDDDDDDDDSDEDEDEDEVSDASVSLIGSANLDIITEPSRHMSIAVCMPAALFYEKDYQKNRYYLKRLCFIRWMATKLVEAQKEARVRATQATPSRALPMNAAHRRKRQRDNDDDGDSDDDDDMGSNAALKLVSIVESVNLGFFGDGVDVRKPVLELRVTDDAGSPWRIRILPYPPQKAFAHAIHRLQHNFHDGVPALDSMSATSQTSLSSSLSARRRDGGGGRGNFRKDEEEVTRNCNIRGKYDWKQTYAYNNGILEDITILDNLATLRKSIAAWKHGADAMVILRVWARNKGLIAKSSPSSSSGAGYGLFTPFALRCIACHALNRKRRELVAQREQADGDDDDDNDGSVRNALSVPSLCTMDVLATFRLMLSGIVDVCRHIVQCRKLVVGSTSKAAANGAGQHEGSCGGSDEDTKTNVTPVLLDDNRLTNLLAHVSFTALAELVLHARKTHALLGSHRAATAPTLNAVSAFYNAIMFREQWPAADLVIHVRVSSSLSSTVPNSTHCFGHDKDFWCREEERVADILRRGLKSRITSLRTSRAAPSFIQSAKPISARNGQGGGDTCSVNCLAMTIIVCIAYNRSTCNSLIDLGPAANNESLQQQFRHLWGEERTTLRRFRDGSVREAVVWDKKDVGGTVITDPCLMRTCDI